MHTFCSVCTNSILFSPAPLTLATFPCFLLLLHFVLLFFQCYHQYPSLYQLSFFVTLFQHSFSLSISIFIPRISSEFPTPHGFHITKFSTSFSYTVPPAPVHVRGMSVFHSLIPQISIPMVFSLITHLNPSLIKSQLLTRSQLPIASTNDYQTSSLITTSSCLICAFIKELLQQQQDRMM